MKITILGSCRQKSISDYYETTSIQERLTYPHYTKEIIQAIEYCKGVSTFNNEFTQYCFRTGILENRAINYQKDLQKEFEDTDLFVVEIASRISYEWNNLYVHHILTESNYGFYDILHIKVKELSDDEIEADILKIRDLIYPKKLIVVSHIYTRDYGKRYELVKLLKTLTNKHNILFMNPSELLKDKENVYVTENILHHYTDNGHKLIGIEYNKYIKNIFNSLDDINKKVCIHKYLTVCKTNPQPPGFADFLRGTIALYIFCKKYNYELYIDNSHPIFNYFKTNSNVISNTTYDTIELLPPISYNDIYNKLENKFKSNESFSIMTNSFYTFNNGNIENWGNISDDCKRYIKDILSPIDSINDILQDVFTNVYKININDPYQVIHLRMGDHFIHNNSFNIEKYNIYYNKISNLINNNYNTKYILISDSSKIAQKLKSEIPQLYYWDNSKVHLGDLKNNTSNAIQDTIVDFFIMSNSNKIYSNDSGFSKVVSILYNIQYNLI